MSIPGYMPKTTQLTDKRYPDYEQIRFTLKNAWNTSYKRQLAVHGLKKSIITPFRAVNNSGDLMARENYSCGGTCQSVQSRPGMFGLKQALGGVQATCVPSVVYNSLQTLVSIPAAACNVKYVYDASDYTTYLKQRAVLRNYNDRSFGGDDSNASQSSLRAIRRY